ncbi:hypothetical protein HMPREF0298_2161 [Corynebacterium lipophiloflavum DSM 44291]|uniref:Uncharacterized protein n=2 Tax=Corynebacterium lipophiloflavum TaxID=161889 RepID=C0XUP1_CORLD|nr:hypothetical protein HMPREF0298_2161 [Corynebacterium lipophiloflavum DSM 44291]
MGNIMATTEKIKDKVQKLLNQAADRQGTAEGESFYAKAFALMASHGFDERDLNSPDEGDDVAHHTVEIRGAYADMQAALLLGIAGALHCTGFGQRVRRSTRISSVAIFGLRRHLDRVNLLFTLLNPAMIAAARTIVAGPYDATSTVVQRRSFMTGFAHSIASRLSEAEHSVAETAGQYALALVDDSRKARQAQEEFGRHHGLYFEDFRSQRTFDGASYGQGVEAGERSDLGQTRVGSRRALPPRNIT